MKRRWKVSLIVLYVAINVGFLGFCFVAAGLAPIAASSGHWPVTEAFLKFASRRSVHTHSLLTKVPADLADPALILRGAGHYETGCRFCHGAPGDRLPPVPAAMTPHPPRLQQPVRELAAEELFWFVKHGVKFTGMPAWPTQQRDDEVWAVVAFLRTLPSLSPHAYEELVGRRMHVAPEVPDTVRNLCVRCHGADGMGRIKGAFPRLAGQTQAYMEQALIAYAAGTRHSGIMQPVAVKLSQAEIREAARYFARLTPMVPVADVPPTPGLGAKIASDGIPTQRIPACAACHGPGPGPRKAFYPRLAGQDEGFLRLQLQLFRTHRRGRSRHSHLMEPVAEHEFSETQLRAVAHHYAHLPVPIPGP